MLTIANQLRNCFKDKRSQFFGDKGYISAALARDLRESRVILVTKFKKRMKNKLITMLDKQLLRKRAVVESVIEQLKNISRDANILVIDRRPTSWSTY